MAGAVAGENKNTNFKAGMLAFGASVAGWSKFRSIMLSGIAVAASVAAPAYADGTDAGETVANTFQLDYQIGATAQATITNDSTLSGPGYDVQGTPTQFTVDRKVDLTLIAVNTPLSVATSSLGTLHFELTNTGNDNQSYSFNVKDIPDDDFDASGLDIAYCVDDNDDGDFDDTVDDCYPLVITTEGTAAMMASVTEDISPDQTIQIRVEGYIKADQSDGDVDDLVLVAETRDPMIWRIEGPSLSHRMITSADSNNENSEEGDAENVLADGVGYAPEDAAGNGRYAAAGAFNVASPDLSAAKTVDVVSMQPVDCATDAVGGNDQYSIPGACIQYVIEITNNGATATASNLNLSDQLPEQVTFVSAALVDVTATGFEDDPAIAGAGPSISAPSLNTNCDGSNCLVQMTDAQLGAGNTGRLVMRAILN